MSKNEGLENLLQIQKELRGFIEEKNALNNFLKWASRKIIQRKFKEIKECFECEVLRLICSVPMKNKNEIANLVNKLAKEFKVTKKGYIKVFFKLYDPENIVVKTAKVKKNKIDEEIHPDIIDGLIADIEKEFSQISVS